MRIFGTTTGWDIVLFELNDDYMMRDLVLDGCWDIHKLNGLLPHNIVQEILSKCFPVGDSSDTMIWALSSERLHAIFFLIWKIMEFLCST